MKTFWKTIPRTCTLIANEHVCFLYRQFSLSLSLTTETRCAPVTLARKFCRPDPPKVCEWSCMNGIGIYGARVSLGRRSYSDGRKHGITWHLCQLLTCFDDGGVTMAPPLRDNSELYMHSIIWHRQHGSSRNKMCVEWVVKLHSVNHGP